MSRIKQLRQRKADLIAEADQLNALVDSGDATDEDTERLDAILAKDGDLDKVNADIAREERLMDERRTMGAIVPDSADDTRIVVGDGPEHRPFASLGEQLRAIAHAGEPGVTDAEWDPRLKPLFQRGGLDVSADASGANSATPSEGGFLVQQDLGAPMFETMFESGAILPRVRRVPIMQNSNGLKIPALDETSRADGSRWGGVRAYWADEADTVTATQAKFRLMDMRLSKLMALGYATEELLADAVAMTTIYSQAFPEELRFKAENAIINGTGSGQPLGLLNSGALVTIAKESGQAAATIVTNNILNMFARLPPRSMTRAVWLINQDVLPQLWGLTLGTGTAVTLLYRPPGVDGESSGAPGGTLLGRPVIPVEYAATLGTAGDIQLVDLDQYLMIDKEGIKQASSMHVRFLYDEMTFRFTYRLDGQPMQRSPLTPFNGSATISPYLALATRA